MRLAGQDKMGYYPPPPRAVELLRDLLAFPQALFAAPDPACAREVRTTVPAAAVEVLSCWRDG
jgi:hypothetical protein